MTCGNDHTSVSDAKELSDEEVAFIRDLFYEQIVPKLKRLDARLGNISCSFAGERYKNWVIGFRSLGSEFEITQIEYDPEADILDLDL